MKNRTSKKLTLQARIFLSHILAIMVGLLSYGILSRLASRHLFAHHLDKLSQRGVFAASLPILLIEGFESAWNYSSFLALVIGATTAACLSYWLTRWINRPLLIIERTAGQFANGNLQHRIVPSTIPELNRLGQSLNQMAQALEQSEQRRRQMVGDLSHELRTPLTIIRGYLEEILGQNLEATPEIYVRLVQETRRLEHLVNDLQNLSKVESGTLSLSLERFSIQPLLDALFSQFESQIAEDGPSLIVECANNLPPVWGDRDRTKQILVNLLGNAIGHTPTGSITIAAWATDVWVWVGVRDTGIGIESEDLAHVFDRFWRSAQSRQRNQYGTGIGLTITKQLVELQGGSIAVDSQIAQGSTFRFCLPQAKC